MALYWSIMRSIVPGILVLAASLTFAGQQKTAPAATGRIEGVVVDGVSDKPVAGVNVTALQEKDRRNITTDPQGRFTFTLPHGTVRLHAAKDGYAPLRVDGHRFPTDGVLVSVGPNQQVRGVRLKLFANGSVSGAVYDTKVKPVQYARAQLLRYWYDDNGDRTLQPAMTGKGGETNDHGEFRIEGVDPGDYLIQITPPILAEREPGEPFTPTKPMPIVVKSGSDTRIDDATLPSVRGAGIRIHLVNQTGETIQNTLNKYLRWKGKDTPGISVVIPLLIMGGPERAEIPVAPGTYEVVAGWSRGNAAPIGLGRRTVEVVRNNVNVEIPVTRGVPVTLQMPAGVRCDLSNDSYGTVPASDNVQAGIYRVTCSGFPSDSYVSQIRQGDRDVMKDGLQVHAVGDNTAVVTLSNIVTTAEGTVTDSKGQKAAGVLLALVPDARDAKHLYRTTTTDQNGAFTLRSIAPGAYKLFAWTELEGAAYKNPDFMKTSEDQGSVIKVDRTPLKEIAVRLAPNSSN